MDKTIEQQSQIADTELVSRILAGETRLFERIIRRYNQRLYRIGMAILEDDTEAEDAMQVTYIKTYGHLAQFEKRSAFNTWITRIMLNECLARKKKKSIFMPVNITQPENSQAITTPASMLINKELNAVLENAVSQLPEKYRLVFVLREIEELSIKETGETLGIEASNVKVRLNRAKTILRDQLSGYMKGNVYAFHLTRCDAMVKRVMGSLKIG